jgi:hypothetical protein
MVDESVVVFQLFIDDEIKANLRCLAIYFYTCIGVGDPIIKSRLTYLTSKTFLCMSPSHDLYLHRHLFVITDLK